MVVDIVAAWPLYWFPLFVALNSLSAFSKIQCESIGPFHSAFDVTAQAPIRLPSTR